MFLHLDHESSDLYSLRKQMEGLNVFRMNRVNRACWIELCKLPPGVRCQT